MKQGSVCVRRKCRDFAKMAIVFAIVLAFFSSALYAGGKAEKSAAVVQTAEAVGESPMLAQRVERGELPPLNERLPVQPKVMTPVDGIGQYGGTWRGGHIGVTHWANEFSGILGRSTLLSFGMEGAELIPQVALGWEVLDDGKAVIINLREGLRWSDGHPMTSADIMFWYEDILQDPMLTPTVPRIWLVRDQLIELEAIDDYTVKFSFNGEYHPHFPYTLALRGIDVTRAAKHFFQQFHPSYTDSADLQKRVAEEGFEEWWQLFSKYWVVTHQNRPDRIPGVPSLHAYIGVEYQPGLTRLERNPYFYKVDPAGNQLPYIDRARVEHVGDGEVLEAMAVAGEVDYYRGFAPSMGLYVAHRESSNLNILMWGDPQGGRVAVSVNRTHQDPVMRELFNNLHFVRALSLAIDREEMNDLIWLGLGEPRQFSLLPPSPYYSDENAYAYTEYNPDEAMRLMTEEVGLRRDGAGRLLRPDGTQIRIDIEMVAQVDWEQGGELIAGYWSDLGIDARARLRAQEFHGQLYNANEMDVRLWGERVPPPSLFYNLEGNFVPGISTHSGIEWNRWVSSNGRDGVEPPQIVKDILAWTEDWYHHADSNVRDAAIRNILRAQAENLWRIGTVGNVPQPMVISGDLRNAPQEGVWYAHDFNFIGMGRPETWYFGTEERRRD